MGSGGFPIDLLLFGMIAAFLVLRLRGILGRKTGFERPAQPDAPQTPVPGMGRPAPALVVDNRVEALVRPLPDPATPSGAALAQMRAVDRNFDPQHFLNGADAAFRLIVTAFAAGDRVALRPLLADDTYRSFESAIAAREAAGETQRSEIKGIESLTIEEAGLSGTQATITLRIVSDQVAETLDRGGRPIAGADAVAEITDVWSFERDLTQSDPAWRLSAARSA
jgi:predicted lipid-binding transport protein (Tim44 family)